MSKQREEFEKSFKKTEIYKREVNIRQKDILEFSNTMNGYFNIIANDAWNMWQQSQKVAVPEWINVNLLSPQSDTKVLVCVDDDVKTSVYRDLDGCGYFDDGVDYKWWMPLPESMIEPQEKHNGN